MILGRGGLESWPVVFEDPEVSKASPDDTATLTGSECDLISLTLYYHISSRGRNLLLDRGDHGRDLKAHGPAMTTRGDIENVYVRKDS